MKEFDDENFTPDEIFVKNIDYLKHPNLELLRNHHFSGKLFSFLNIKQDKQYFENLIENTSNHFLKLVYFEVIKKNSADGEIFQLLNRFQLIPLYFAVAKNLVIQNNMYFQSHFLLEDYIRLYRYAKIPTQEVFDNFGEIFRIVLEKQLHPINFLKIFINLDSKILRSAIISKYIFKALDYFVNKEFYGNSTLGFKFTDEILRFYEKINKPDEITTKKIIFATKYLNFIDSEMDKGNLEDDNMHHLMLKLNVFLHPKLEVIQKYCPDREVLKNEVKFEIDRISKLIPKATKGMLKIPYELQISEEMINESLSRFKDDTIEEIIAKTVITDCFIPNLVKDENNISLMGLFGLQVYDGSGNVKKFDKTPQIKNEKGATDIHMMWQKYSSNHSILILLFQQLIKKFDPVELMNKIFAPMFTSKVMNDVTKKLIQITLSSFFNELFFPSMQSSIFQIESVLRNICLKNEIETRSIGPEKERQKSMGSLIQVLRENKIVKEKILVFIEWFLSNESNQISKNYRNDIAHGLDSMEQFNGIYTKENALSLILIYLSLSKYGFNYPN